MSQLAHSITHSSSADPRITPHVLRQHHLNQINSHLDHPDLPNTHFNSLKPYHHSKSFSLDPASTTPLPPQKSIPPITKQTNLPNFSQSDQITFEALPSSSISSLFQPSHASKPARPLHQKAQSETAMRLELPHSFPSSHLDKIPMLRKKSGEVVRSSLKLAGCSPGASRSVSYASTRSAPSTPTLGPKAVHFDSHLEHVRHFLSQQRPMAVSRDGSPIETETEGEEEYPFPDMGYAPDGTTRKNGNRAPRTKLVIELPNMPLHDRGPLKVCLKSIELGPDAKTLQGIVQVENLSFEKRVAVRFTFDKWQTVSEVTADYFSSGRPSSKLDIRPTVDLFGFTIKLQDVLARIEDREMEIAVRYQAAGGEFWDNNSDMNYHVRFKHLRTNNAHSSPNPQQSSADQLIPLRLQSTQDTTRTAPANTSTNDTCPWAVTLRAELDRLVGDDLGVSMASGMMKKKLNLGTSSGSPDFDGSLGGMARLKSGTGFSARYDFGSSLKQAASKPKQQAARASRFELALPFPVTPVPIEWLGVKPATPDDPIRRPVAGPSTTFEHAKALSTDALADQRQPSGSHANCKRWSLPAFVNLPNLPPSPPQECPSLAPIVPHTKPSNEPPARAVAEDFSSQAPSSSGPLKPHHGGPFVAFHHQRPSGLVSPQSPSLTDEST